MKILEIELLSNDLIKTEKFYSKILGFETEKKSTELLKFKIAIEYLYVILATD